MARCVPSRLVIHSAMAPTAPLSSISLPNSAPSRNNGKKEATKRAAEPMKVWVQCASKGSPAKAAATSAAAGASSSTDQPRKARYTSSPRPSRMPSNPTASDPFQQAVDIGGGAAADIGAVLVEEGLRRLAALVPQHGQEGPFGVQLGRGTEIDHDAVLHDVHAHPAPHGAFRGAGIGDAAHHRQHLQLLQRDRV